MIYPKDSEWSDWGIANPIHRLFVLLWHELFAERTSDTWQVRTCNIRSLIAEIAEVARVASTHEPYQHNVPALLDEAKEVAELDPIVLRRFPFVSSNLEVLKRTYHTDKDLLALSRQAKVMLAQLATYHAELVAHARGVLASCNPDEKEAMESVARALGIEVSLAGYSMPFLRQTLNILLDTRETDFLRRFDALMNACSGIVRSFTCVFSVYWDRRKTREFPNLSAFGISMCERPPSKLSSEAEREFYARSPRRCVFATIGVQGLDCFGARQKAEERFSDAVACMKLVCPSTTLHVEMTAALVMEESRKTVIVDADTSRLAYLRDVSAPERKLASLLKAHRELPSEDSDHLASALRYHRVALTAATDDGRLVNLWIALECLVRGTSGRSVIERVCRYIPKSIAVMNPAKLLRGFAIDIRNSWANRDPSRLLALLPSSKPYQLNPADLLDAVLEPDEGPIATELYKLLQGHVLLNHRLFRFRRKLFNAPNELARAVDTNMSHIDWQLRRIYRERNNVMHSGRSSPVTRQLVQHLHTYLVFAVHSLLHDLLTGHAHSISEALEYRALLCEQFLLQLRNRRSTITRMVLLHPDRLFSQQDSLVAWPAS